MAIRELTNIELLNVAGGGDEIVITAPRMTSEGGYGGAGSSYGGTSGGAATGGAGGGSHSTAPVPQQPQVPLPPTTSTPEGPQFDVGSGVTIGGAKITPPYSGPIQGIGVHVDF